MGNSFDSRYRQQGSRPFKPNLQRLDSEQTQRKTTPNDFEVETVMLDDSGNASTLSGAKSRYIVRYRSEEERLAHQLEQTQTKLRMALEQGHKLRAKTNRIEDELKTLKIQQSQGEISDSQWKKKFCDLDKQHKNLKEDFDVLVARNKNGRDFLRQQEEVIGLLSEELQKERVDKNDLLHGSLSSLSKLSESGSKDKKAKKLVQQLEIDKHLLEERLRDLTERNQRGREYLNKLEIEKRQQENIIAELETDLHNAKSERNELFTRLGMSSSIRLLENQEFIDFSDENRPTTMIDRYQKLYDNEWADTFTELTEGHRIPEQQAIQTLLDIMSISFQHCQTLATSQLDDIEKTLREFNATAESMEGKEFITFLKAQRKMKYGYNIEAIKKSLESQLHSMLPIVEPKTATKNYISAVIDLCWFLNVQDPPCTISLDLRRGEPFQTDKYRVYRQSGKQVDYVVWPVLYLHQGGGVLCKGVAQAQLEKHDQDEDEPIIVTTLMPLAGDTGQPTTEIDTSADHWNSEDRDQANKAHYVNYPSTTSNDMLFVKSPSIPDPLAFEETEITVAKNGSTQNALTEEADKTRNNEYFAKIEMNGTEIVNEDGSPYQYLYAQVNKPKTQKQNNFFTSYKNRTDVEYEEVEYSADECITRF